MFLLFDLLMRRALGWLGLRGAPQGHLDRCAFAQQLPFA